MAKKHHPPRAERAPVPILVHPDVNLPHLARAIAAARLQVRWSPARRQLVLEVRS